MSGRRSGRRIQRPNQITFDTSPEGKRQLDEIVSLAKIVRPETNRTQVLMKMINDLYTRLCIAGALPLPKPPETFDVAISAGNNGHENTSIDP